MTKLVYPSFFFSYKYCVVYLYDELSQMLYYGPDTSVTEKSFRVNEPTDKQAGWF
jgi:hypothetical protein